MASDNTPRVSVVIPTWNGEELLGIVLGSLEHQTFREFEVIVVDNGSTDGTLMALRQAYPWVQVIALAENRGFTAAVNAGIRASSGEYVALLNNDVEVDPGWLAALVDTLDEEPAAGFAASRIRRYWDRKRIDCAGDIVGLSPYGRGRDELDGEAFDRRAWVASACAAAAIYRRRLFDEIGLFNDTFVSYFEDVELGLRAQIAGYRCLYVPEAIAYHIGSATANRVPGLKAYHGLRNVVWLYLTTFPRRYLLRYLPRLVISKAWFAMVERRPMLFVRTATATLLRLPKIRARRREVFAHRRVTDARLLELLERPRPITAAIGERLRALFVRADEGDGGEAGLQELHQPQEGRTKGPRSTRDGRARVSRVVN